MAEQRFQHEAVPGWLEAQRRAAELAERRELGVGVAQHALEPAARQRDGGDERRITAEALSELGVERVARAPELTRRRLFAVGRVENVTQVAAVADHQRAALAYRHFAGRTALIADGDEA